MLRIAVCDDDARFLSKFSELLTSYFSNENCTISLKEYTSGIEFIEDVEDRKLIYDVIFLDICMPIISGIDIAKRLRLLPTQAFLLVFTTNMENEWSEGYKYEAFRFIIKKRLESDLAETVNKISLKLTNITEMKEQLMIKRKNKGTIENLIVMKNDILYFEKDKVRRIWLTTIHGKYELLVKPLTYYKQLLNSEAFDVFIRNFLINMNRIETYEENSFILAGKIKTPLGSSRKSQKESKVRYMQFLTERI